MSQKNPKGFWFFRLNFFNSKAHSYSWNCLSQLWVQKNHTHIKYRVLLLFLTIINKSIEQQVLEEVIFTSPWIFIVQSSLCPRNGVCGYSVISFQTYKEPSIWGNSGGEHFHADSETSRMTPVWRCHAWLWKGKNNASLEKGEKSLVQSQFWCKI